jgi:hypothetical protein
LRSESLPRLVFWRFPKGCQCLPACHAPRLQLTHVPCCSTPGRH